MSLISEHTELCRRLNRELSFEEWSEAVSAAGVAAKVARETEATLVKRSEASLRATCVVYTEALRRKESK